MHSAMDDGGVGLAGNRVGLTSHGRSVSVKERNAKSGPLFYRNLTINSNVGPTAVPAKTDAGFNEWLADQVKFSQSLSLTSPRVGLLQRLPGRLKSLGRVGAKKSICNFSIHVHGCDRLPTSLEGLEVVVKWERRGMSVGTSPAVVENGVAKFEQALTINCTMYYSPGAGKCMRFHPKPSTLTCHVLVGGKEVDIGNHVVDLASLLPASAKPQDAKPRTVSFKLANKAVGGLLVATFGYSMKLPRGEVTLVRADSKAFRAARSVSSDAAGVASGGSSSADSNSLSLISPGSSESAGDMLSPASAFNDIPRVSSRNSLVLGFEAVQEEGEVDSGESPDGKEQEEEESVTDATVAVATSSAKGASAITQSSASSSGTSTGTSRMSQAVSAFKWSVPASVATSAREGYDSFVQAIGGEAGGEQEGEKEGENESEKGEEEVKIECNVSSSASASTRASANASVPKQIAVVDGKVVLEERKVGEKEEEAEAEMEMEMVSEEFLELLMKTEAMKDVQITIEEVGEDEEMQEAEEEEEEEEDEDEDVEEDEEEEDIFGDDSEGEADLAPIAEEGDGDGEGEGAGVHVFLKEAEREARKAEMEESSRRRANQLNMEEDEVLIKKFGGKIPLPGTAAVAATTTTPSAVAPVIAAAGGGCGDSSSALVAVKGGGGTPTQRTTMPAGGALVPLMRTGSGKMGSGKKKGAGKGKAGKVAARPLALEGADKAAVKQGGAAEEEGEGRVVSRSAAAAAAAASVVTRERPSVRDLVRTIEMGGLGALATTSTAESMDAALLLSNQSGVPVVSSINQKGNKLDGHPPQSVSTSASASAPASASAYVSALASVFSLAGLPAVPRASDPLDLALPATTSPPSLLEGMGSAIALKGGGFLTTMSAQCFEEGGSRLVMQFSQPLVIPSLPGSDPSSPSSLMHSLASLGLDSLSSEALRLMPLPDLSGKPLELMAAEGLLFLEAQAQDREDRDREHRTGMVQGGADRSTPGLQSSSPSPDLTHASTSTALRATSSSSSSLAPLSSSPSHHSSTHCVPHSARNQAIARLLTRLHQRHMLPGLPDSATAATDGVASASVGGSIVPATPGGAVTTARASSPSSTALLSLPACQQQALMAAAAGDDRALATLPPKEIAAIAQAAGVQADSYADLVAQLNRSGGLHAAGAVASGGGLGVGMVRVGGGVEETESVPLPELASLAVWQLESLAMEGLRVQSNEAEQQAPAVEEAGRITAAAAWHSITGTGTGTEAGSGRGMRSSSSSGAISGMGSSHSLAGSNWTGRMLSGSRSSESTGGSVGRSDGVLPITGSVPLPMLTGSQQSLASDPHGLMTVYSGARTTTEGGMSLALTLDDWLQMDAGQFKDAALEDDTMAILLAHGAAHARSVGGSAADGVALVHDLVTKEHGKYITAAAAGRGGQGGGAGMGGSVALRGTAAGSVSHVGGGNSSSSISSVPSSGVMGDTVNVAMLVQLRDPLRNFEPVGVPMIAVLQAQRAPADHAAATAAAALSGFNAAALPAATGGAAVATAGGTTGRLTFCQPAVQALPAPMEGQSLPLAVRADSNQLQASPGVRSSQGSVKGGGAEKGRSEPGVRGASEEAQPSQQPTFQLTGVHMVGLKAKQGSKAVWGTEKQAQAGSRWLAANGMGKKGGKPSKFMNKAPEKVTVKEGDTLWSISARTYGNGMKWKDVAKMNPHIRNPDIILPDQTIRMR